jgi:hypothetical protein
MSTGITGGSLLHQQSAGVQGKAALHLGHFLFVCWSAIMQIYKV